MCRPERPLTTSNKALRELQEWLREQRRRTRQGYRALSVRAGCHATTLQRAASGEIVPKLQTVLNYARACDASPEEARLLWKRARYEATRLTRAGRDRPAPRPEFVRDFVDLGAALVELYRKAGSPPYRTMEQRAGGYGALPRSSAHRIVNKQAMPHGLQQFQAYLRACEVPELEWPDWEAAWTRAWRHEKQDDLSTLSTATAQYVPGSATVRALVALGEYAEPPGLDERRYIRNLRDPHGADGHMYVSSNGMLQRVAVEVKRTDMALDRNRWRPRQSRNVPERPEQGQLAFTLPDPEPEPGALF
ncbi:helix-turn-helix domain-containing protein [Streptomyces sp. NRRL S-340]|uniref:helix-turn-helix domain-containing protein n=1 Tax=Streptomyces sp. NRRL S-340 TaxID=1463901 RepID=UPI00068F9A92|nr:helix-turn-helix transcriptional regulator [Streptomyces sp. NRRL S-340]